MTTEFSKLRFAAHPDGRTAMLASTGHLDTVPWIVTHDGKFDGMCANADLAHLSTL